MDDARSHRERSRCDADFALELAKRSVRSGWEIVVRFYAALHQTQAYLLTKNHRFQAKRHDERWKAIRASPELAKGRFPSAYKWLQDVSEQVRYDAGFVARPKDFESAEQNQIIVHSVLDAKLTRTLGSP